MSKSKTGTYGEDYGHDFQCHILAVLSRSPDAIAMYRTALNHRYFVDESTKIVSQTLFAHFDKHSRLPTKTTLDEEAKAASTEEQQAGVHKLVTKLYKDDVSDTAAVLEKIVGFGKEQAMVNAIIDCADYISTNNKGKILPRIHEAQLVGEDLLNIGIHYNDAALRPAWYLDSREQDTIPTGIPHLDYALGGGLGRGELGVLLAPPKVGKCVKPDTPVWTPESGYMTMQEVVDTRPNVYGVDSLSQQPAIVSITDSTSDKNRKIMEVYLKSGRVIRGFADSHPTLTVRGWIPTGELGEGDIVVSASTLPLTGYCSPSDYDTAWLHGALCGDGGLTGRTPNLSINHTDEGDLLTVAKIERIYPSLVGSSFQDSENGTRVSLSVDYYRLMREWGIERVKAPQKSIPRIIWEKGREAVAAFLAGLFDTDGSAYLKGGRPVAEFGVASQELAEGFLTGLHTLGVYANIREKKVKLGDKVFDAWVVTILDGESVQEFWKACSKYGAHSRKWSTLSGAKKGRGAYYNRLPSCVWERVLERLGGKSRWESPNIADLFRALPIGVDPRKSSEYVRRAIRRKSRVSPEVARVIGEFLQDEWIIQSASGAYCFDEVEAVREVEISDTLDIEVEASAHTFFASGVFTHNTTTLVNFGHGALRHAQDIGLNVVHYSLEMKDKKIAMRYDDRLAGKNIHIKKTDPEKYQIALDARAEKFIRGELYIKSYPTRSATVSMFRSHMSMLAAQGITVDMVIVDYADIVKAERRLGEFRHEQAGIYEDLRALAGEFDCAVWTASQTNRSGLEKEQLSMADFGEAFEKAHIMDVGVALVQTPDEKIDSECRLFLMGVRDAEDQRTVKCKILRNRCMISSTTLISSQGLPVMTPYDDDSEEGQKKTAESVKRTLGIGNKKKSKKPQRSKGRQERPTRQVMA